MPHWVIRRAYHLLRSVSCTGCRDQSCDGVNFVVYLQAVWLCSLCDIICSYLQKDIRRRSSCVGQHLANLTQGNLNLCDLWCTAFRQWMHIAVYGMYVQHTKFCKIAIQFLIMNFLWLCGPKPTLADIYRASHVQNQQMNYAVLWPYFWNKLEMGPYTHPPYVFLIYKRHSGELLIHHGVSVSHGGQNTTAMVSWADLSAVIMSVGGRIMYATS